MRRPPAPLALGVAAAAVTLLLGCPRPGGSIAGLGRTMGCGKDTDCKGERICAAGECVEPAPVPAAGPAGLAAAAPAALVENGATESGARDAAAPPPIVLPGASPAFHQTWTHNGRSRFQVTRSTPRRLGSVPTGGSVVSSPAITDDGIAIFGSHDKSIYGVALSEGKPTPRWSRATGDLVWCSPALGPGAKGPVAYVGSDDDRLYALAVEDGAVLWTFTAGPCRRAIGFGPEAARCDVDAVTVGPDGTIVVTADGAYGLRADGTVRWRFPLRAHCGGAAAMAADGSVYFGCQDGRLHALDADGIQRWEFRAGDDIDSAPAVADDGTIYFGSDDGRLYAVTPAGALRWAVKTGGDVRSSPVIAVDGTVHAGSFDGRVYAVRPDGTIAWTFATADRVLSSPTLDASGVVLIGSQDDRLYALAPDGNLLWSVLLDGDVDGTPAIGPGGVIAVGSDDRRLHLLR